MEKRKNVIWTNGNGLENGSFRGFLPIVMSDIEIPELIGLLIGAF
jgi:hypothetical protein